MKFELELREDEIKELEEIAQREEVSIDEVVEYYFRIGKHQ